MQLDERLRDLCAVLILEIGTTDELLAPGIEPRSDRQQQILRAAQGTRLSQRQEPMVLERHQLLVEAAGDHEATPAAWTVGMAEPRVALLEPVAVRGPRPGLDDAREVAEVMGDRRRELERRRRRRLEL